MFAGQVNHVQLYSVFPRLWIMTANSIDLFPVEWRQSYNIKKDQFDLFKIDLDKSFRPRGMNLGWRTANFQKCERILSRS